MNNFVALIGHMKRNPVVVIPLYFEKKSDPQPRYPISTLFQKIKSRPTSLATLLTARRDHFLPIHEERARPRPPTWMQPPTTTHVDATTHNHHVDATTHNHHVDATTIFFSDSLTFEPIFTFIAYSNPFPSLRS